MCETLAGLKQAVAAFAARFDAALVPPAQLGQVLSEAGTLEKIFASIAAACAARMAGGSAGSLREAVSGLARASGTSLSEAAKALEAAKQIESRPELAAAVRSGELSRQQAGLVAGAVANNPASAPQLLELARSASMRELAEESLRARSSGQGGEARRQAVHASRFLRYYTSTDGAFNLHGRATPEQGAMVMAALRPLADKAFEAARKEGRRERPEAYTWDALVGLASSGGGGRGGRGAPRAEVMVRVDHSALLRGYPLDGEVCDIPGFGPTTVEAVRDMIATGDPVLKAIVTNAKAVVGVVHMRRRPNAYQKSALDWLFPTCAANGCGTRAWFLETDHREDWARTHVTVRKYPRSLTWGSPRRGRPRSPAGWVVVVSQAHPASTTLDIRRSAFLRSIRARLNEPSNTGNSAPSSEGGSTSSIASFMTRLMRSRRGAGERRQWCGRGRRWREGRAANL